MEIFKELTKKSPHCSFSKIEICQNHNKSFHYSWHTYMLNNEIYTATFWQNGNNGTNDNRMLSGKSWLILLPHLNFLINCANNFDLDRLWTNYVQIMLRLWLNSIDKPLWCLSDYLILQNQDISDIKPTHFVNRNKCPTRIR